MKRIYFLFLSLSAELILMAQSGRVMPEDYMDYPDYHYSSSDDNYVGLYMSLFILIVMGIGILWFKYALKNSRNEEIRSKTQFLTNRELYAYESATMAVNYSFYKI